MEDRKEYAMTIKELEKVMENYGGEIVVIINGEYYELERSERRIP